MIFSENFSKDNMCALSLSPKVFKTRDQVVNVIFFFVTNFFKHQKKKKLKNKKCGKKTNS